MSDDDAIVTSHSGTTKSVNLVNGFLLSYSFSCSINSRHIVKFLKKNIQSSNVLCQMSPILRMLSLALTRRVVTD